MAEMGHFRTDAPQQRASSLDHFVGELLELRWHFNAERPGGLEVDHQLELDWSLQFLNTFWS